MKFSPEQLVQFSCVDFTHRFCPDVLLSASQNGMYAGAGKYVGAYIARQKKLGMLIGELDLMLTWAAKNILFCEIKSSTGRLSDSQKSIIRIREKQGFDCRMAHSLDEYVSVLRAYGVPMKTGFYAGIGRI